MNERTHKGKIGRICGRPSGIREIATAPAPRSTLFKRPVAARATVVLRALSSTSIHGSIGLRGRLAKIATPPEARTFQ